MEETLELLRERLKAANVAIEPGAGIILIGGASQLTGMREVAVRVFDRPVRLGRPRRVPHLADAASGPAFCTAAGILHRAAFGPREAVGRQSPGAERTPVRPHGRRRRQSGRQADRLAARQPLAAGPAAKPLAASRNPVNPRCFDPTAPLGAEATQRMQLTVG